MYVRMYLYLHTFCVLARTCADPESFVRGGPTLTIFFSSLIRGGRIKIPLLTAHHGPTSETSFKWRFDGVHMKWRFAGVPKMALH